MKNRLKQYWSLFITFLKIGLFTFGGGYAMIGLIEEEVVIKHKWLRSMEMNDVFTISECTPGPISINCATYVGYKTAGVIGSIVATLGLCVPSFVIIYLIAMFLDQFMDNRIIYNMLMGIKAVVGILVFLGFYKLYKNMEKDVLSYILLIVVALVFFFFTLFSVNFSSIFFILGGALVGLIVYLIYVFKHKEKHK